jgi:hypothetical protein
MFKLGPGFLAALQKQLENLPYEELQKADRPGGLDVHDLVQLILRPRDHTVDMPDYVDKKETIDHQTINENIRQAGEEAILNGEVAFCVFLGDRKISNIPRGLLKIPSLDMSLLSIKLLQSVDSKHVWVMADPRDKEETEKILGTLSGGEKVDLLNHFLTFGLTPDNQISLADGKPRLTPCGTGDLLNALRDSDVFKNFTESGGKYVFVVNAENICAHLDSALVGQHIVEKKQVTCEVVKKAPHETGSLLCNNMGMLQIVSQKRLSRESSLEELDLMSTGTLIFNANIDFNLMKWRWHRARTFTSSGIIDHYQRHLTDMTEMFETQYVLSDRSESYMSIDCENDLKEAVQILDGNK